MAQVSEQHHFASQLGSAAIAHPSGMEGFPPSAPALYHLEDDVEMSSSSSPATERHHHESQLGEKAVAPPGGLKNYPPPAPALYHLEDKHTFDSQVGSSAIAPPKGDIVHPAPIPAQPHLDDDDDDQSGSESPVVRPFQHLSLTSNPALYSPKLIPLDDRHTSTSQLGPSAIAAPANTANLPPAAPALHHLNDSYTHESQLGQAAIAPPADLTFNPVREEEELTFTDLPPFPTDVPTAPLLRISLKKLVEGDETEINKVWKASQELGFFYLDLRDASTTESQINGPALLKDVDALFSLGEQVFDLPTSEKQKYDFIEEGSYFGYKGLGAGVVDAQGTRDRNEFYNVSKDDMLGISEPLPAPELLRKQASRDLLGGYIKRCHAVVTLLLGILNTKLGLPDGKLQSLHRLEAVSGDQVRWVNSPPQPEDDRKKALGEHTGRFHLSPVTPPPTDPLLSSHADFGTLTLLANRLGGLQILPPSTPLNSSPQWSYVRPLRSHLIVNLGDALVRFSASILRSNIHRVVSPPGEQAGYKRMSLVYFARPEDEVVLKALRESEMISDACKKQGIGEDDEEEITAKEWILRRALGRRVGGNYGKSEGTEGGRV
jgi:isopenicillin N synthase-like dioxygenase